MRWESVDMKQINNVVQKTVVKLFKGSSFSRVGLRLNSRSTDSTQPRQQAHANRQMNCIAH